ncbi:TPA: hypothetical protein NJ503_002177 [Vibrio parahaemolyticus]|nr:hypothetical protein [Vibrio parahaemolyticus]
MEKMIISPPSTGESCAITTYDKFKQAALLFDKLHMDFGNVEILPMLGNPPVEVLFCLPECDSLDSLTREQVIHNANTKTGEDPTNLIWRSRINNYAQKGIEVIPLYGSESHFNMDFDSGFHIGYQGALNNVHIPDSNLLSWEQVLEFRSDKEAKRKYRALRCWLREALVGKSVAEATDIIGLKLDDYEWAIRKHGIKTTTSAMRQILDPKTIAILSGSATTAALLGGPIAGAIASGIALGSKVITWGAERKLELEDIKRGSHSEVAIIYEINDKFSC